MALKHRKLFPTNSTENCMIYFCEPYPYGDPNFFIPLPPPPPPPPTFSSSTNALSPYVIIILSLFGAVSVLLATYVVLAKRCCCQTRTQDDDHQDFLDHNRGPEIDHPIWYINTVGLQPSLINSIAVLKYKRGDTLVDGSTCSVCLSEFVEDETLRLLPKCNHAFHIACIDTWLRSHTNCPLCRAKITLTTLREPTSGTSGENTILVNNASGNLGIDNANRDESEEITDWKKIRDSSVVNLIRENGRRSVSMDFSREVGVNIGSDEFSDDPLQGGKVNHRDYKQNHNFGTNQAQDNGIVKKAEDKGNMSIGSSSSAESLHMSPLTMKRSFSCSGRLFSSSRYSNNKSSSSILPL